MLLELLVIVSGYPSSIDPRMLKHPSEQQILERALQFGEKVAYISDHCFRLTGPAVEVLQEMLNDYFDLVVGLEAQVLSGVLQDMCSVLAKTVDPHERLFSYCCELLASQNHLDTKVAVQLRKDQYSGFSKIAQIAAACLVAFDKYYIKQMSPWLMWGTLPRSDVLYPDFPECSQLVQNIGDCLRVIDTAHSHAQFLEYADFTRDKLGELSYPLEHNQFKAMLVCIQNHLDTRLLPILYKQLQVEDLVAVLRKIVLCGSPLFCMCFVESHPVDYVTFDMAHLTASIALYHEDTSELSAEQHDLAQSMLRIEEASSPAELHDFGDLLSAANVQVDVTIPRELGLFITPGQGDIYGVMFYYLLSLWVVNDSLKQRNPATFKFKQFLNTIWAHFQRVIHEYMDELQKLFAELSLPQVATAHTKLLKQLGKRLLLDNKQQRMLLKAVLLDASLVARGEQLEEGESIKNFVDYLSEETEHVALAASLSLGGCILVGFVL